MATTLQRERETRRERRPRRPAAAPPPARFQHRAAAALAWALALLVVSQLGLRLAVDRWWPELRDPSFEVKARRLAQLVADGPTPPVTVVALGSSVTRNGLKAQAVEERLGQQLGRRAAVVNLSNWGAGPLTQLVWARRVLERGIRPDLVCVEVTPFTFAAAGPPDDLGRFPDHLLSATDLDVIERYGGDAELRRNWQQGRWTPAYFHRLTIVTYLAEWLLPRRDRMPCWADSLDERFWQADPPLAPAELQAALGRVRAVGTGRLRDFTPNANTLRVLDELLELLQQAQVPTVVILAPEGPTLRSLYPPEALRAFADRIADLSRQHGSRFVNALQWLDDDALYIDSVHPNLVGAEAFSSRLAAEVMLPALAPR